MPTLLSLFLYLHIAAGFVALVSGLVAAIARKRRGLHSRMGMVYFIAMSLVLVTATVLALAKDLPFLFGVGLFSFYLCMSGFMSARWKNKVPKWLAWLVPALGVIGAVVLFLIANVVAIVFGGILILNITLEVLVLTGLREPKGGKLAWMFSHVGRMGGSYIATVTAFVVTNVELEALHWLPWLVPTLVGTAVLTRWNVRMRKKMAASKEQSA